MGPFFLVLFFSLNLKAESTSFELRDRSPNTLAVGYQPIATWLPSKKSIAYAFSFNSRWMLELEYAWASFSLPVVGIDLGEITQRSTSLHARRFIANSFHVSFGAVYNQFKARLGSDFVDQFNNQLNSSFEVDNFAITLGLGNRWQWESGFSFGIDWFRMAMPIYETRVRDDVLDNVDGSDETDDIKTVIRTFNRFPTFILFGFQLGYSF